MLQTEIIKKNQNTFYMQQRFSRTSCRLGDNVEKYGTAVQATDDNTEHAHCMLDN